ncbi:unnamed protein product, partial [Mesorhabditis spiculigera]
MSQVEGAPKKSVYVPPHRRGLPEGAAEVDSTTSTHASHSSPRYSSGRYGGGQRGNYGSYGNTKDSRPPSRNDRDYQRPDSGYGGTPQKDRRGSFFDRPGQGRGASGDGSAAVERAWTVQGPRDTQYEAEVFAHAGSGINFDKYEEIPVEATGGSVPDPIHSFDELALHPWVMENITLTGYTRPTPVQKHSIPAIMAGLDLMSCAQTGSGKTAAFLVPVIHSILQGGPSALLPASTTHSHRRQHFPAALVIAPTRELALQAFLLIEGTSKHFRFIMRLVNSRTGPRFVSAFFTGLGCHVLIATPGRLIDILEQGWIGLEGCRNLILDEADRMLDMGFEPQIRQIVQRSGMPQRGERVTAMFSATFAKDIQVLAQDFLLPDYVFLAVGRVGSTSENIQQKILFVNDAEKREFLMDLLDAQDPNALTVVFVETKPTMLFRFMEICHRSLVKNLITFRSGRAPIMVATAVAARGLDIPNVKHVINYDLPGDIDEYVHRIGRTGRAGNVGLATSFFSSRNVRLARDLMNLIVESNQEVPAFLEEAARGNMPGSAKDGGSYNRRDGGGRSFGARDHRAQPPNSNAAARTSNSFGDNNLSRRPPARGAGAAAHWFD